MKKLICSLLLTGIFIQLHAQKIDFTDVSQSDQEAKAILDQIKSNLDSYQGIAVDFDYVVIVPEEAPQKQQGNMLVVGERYALDLDDYGIYSDGQTVWMYDKAIEEVNINNKEENDDLLISSPTDLLDFYLKDDFIYAFYDELVVDGRIITMIDFKPVDDEQEFFKIRLSVDKKQNLPAGAKLFYRDGTRIEVVFKKVSNQSQFSDSDFILTKEDVDSGVEFIDLRY